MGNTQSGRTVRWRRVLTVVAILSRHAFGYLVGLLRLDWLVPFHRGLFGHAPRAIRYTRPEHVRLAVEELGAASIKLGQILSTRGDVLAPAYQQEFAKLQDAAPPEPAAAVRAIIESELVSPLEELFLTFDPVPVAAASIGQAHAGMLPDGSEVIVKIRRPGVVDEVELDLDILNRAVGLLTHWSGIARRYDLMGLTQEFASTLRSELDYRREARDAQQFAANFADDLTIRIPNVYQHLSTGQVLTLERLHGLKISDLAGLDAAGINRAQLAERATTLILKMIFEHGLFHADPHPGNFFIEADGRIGLIDFGMIGTVDAPTRAALRAVLIALSGGDVAPLVDAFLALDPTTPIRNRAQLVEDFEAIITGQLARPLGTLALGALLSEVLGIVRRHRLRFPSNLALLAKTFVMSEGLAAALDPSFEFPVAVAPYLPRLLATD